jgi:hypothetical protein
MHFVTLATCTSGPCGHANSEIGALHSPALVFDMFIFQPSTHMSSHMWLYILKYLSVICFGAVGVMDRVLCPVSQHLFICNSLMLQ